MQEVAEEQDAAYIPMPKGRGFTPHFDKSSPFRHNRGGAFVTNALFVVKSYNKQKVAIFCFLY